MASSRSSLRLLQSLSRACSSQIRQLHLTGPATYPSSLLSSDSKSTFSARTGSSISSEETSISTATTMTYYGRFETSPLAQTLGDTSTIDYTGFHTSPLSKAAGDSTINFRGFHTSPLSQAVGDSSTIDYMRFPDFDPDLEPEAPIRVPLLPQSTLTPTTISYAAEEQAEEETVGLENPADIFAEPANWQRAFGPRSSPHRQTVRFMLLRQYWLICKIQVISAMRASRTFRRWRREVGEMYPKTHPREGH